MEHPAGQREAKRSSQEGDQHAFCEQLAQEPPPARAKRQSHGNLFAPGRGSGEQEACDVGTRDEEKQRDGSHRGTDDSPHFGVKGTEVIAARDNRNGGVTFYFRIGSA